MPKGKKKLKDWVVCLIRLRDRDIICTHYNAEIRENLQTHVEADIKWFTLKAYKDFNDGNEDWSIDDLEEYLKSEDYTIISHVTVHGIT